MTLDLMMLLYMDLSVIKREKKKLSLFVLLAMHRGLCGGGGKTLVGARVGDQR